MRNFKKQNGITLIALVITIIVMLILVSVTISMAINGNLFNYAGQGAQKTEQAKQEELELSEGKIKVDNVIYNSIDEYIYREDTGVKLADDYGHSYTVSEAGRYYFYSYTYGQNFMTVFDVAKNEKGELVATKLGEYSNETGMIKGATGMATGTGLEGTCLSSPDELAPTAYVALVYFYYYLTPGKYYYPYETSGDAVIVYEDGTFEKSYSLTYDECIDVCGKLCCSATTYDQRTSN